MNMAHVTSCVKKEEKCKYDYEVTFSSNLSLDFCDEEVFQYFLYDTERAIEDLDDLCVKVLAERISRIMLNYVMTQKKSESTIRALALKRITPECDKSWRLYLEEAMDAAISKMKELGYIDDYDYCRRYINTTLKLKPTSLTMIRHELEAVRGVEASIVEHVLSEYDIDDSLAAYMLLKKKAVSEKNRNKLFAFLMRKGFTYESVYSAYNRYIEENEELES